eukprot:2970187-Rhodomonas_salina.3
MPASLTERIPCHQTVTQTAQTQQGIPAAASQVHEPAGEGDVVSAEGGAWHADLGLPEDDGIREA